MGNLNVSLFTTRGASLRLRIIMKLLYTFLLLSISFTTVKAQVTHDCTGRPVSSDGEITLELVSDDLDRPVDITYAPGMKDHIFVVEHPGRIRVIDISGEQDQLQSTAFLNITDIVDFGGESGLLGLAFHPDYDENGYFFVCYISTRSGSRESIISRFQVSENPLIAVRGSEEILMRFPQPRSNHNGGQLAFSPIDGMLYISVGDGGKQRDPDNNAQNPLSYLGKILRIDVNPQGDVPYSIPTDNPFKDQDDIQPEIWGLGLRNPWRMAFDSKTGDLYVGDVGQGTWEEVSFVPAGEYIETGVNFEWRVLEGAHAHNTGTAYAHGLRLGPIYEYHHSSGAVRGVSVTGGHVYRGCSIPQLDGTYFFADYGANWVRSFKVNEAGARGELTNHTPDLNAGIADFDNGVDSISAFGTDSFGEIYICDLQTKLFRIIPTDTEPPAPITFRRGDVNSDGRRDISDMITSLFHLFKGVPETLICDDAMDMNDDGVKDITDPIFGLSSFFFGIGIIPPPDASCGEDPTPDDLDCQLPFCED